MWIQQVGYAFIGLIIVTGILFILGILIFNILKKYSRYFFKGDNLKYLNIVFVGTILLSLSQLFGPLVASTYPIICGPDASDYSLSINNIYINLTYNSTSGNYSVAATTDSQGQFYGDKNETSIPLGEEFSIINGIAAVDSNPFVNYDSQIFLDAMGPKNVIMSLSRPVIKVGQSSDLTIKFVNRPYPGPYPIRIRGVGGDGKIREAMMVIGISVPLIDISGGGTVYTTTQSGGGTVYTPTQSGSSYIYNGSGYIYDAPSGSVGTYATPIRTFNVTNSSYATVDTYTPIYSNADTYTPIYSNVDTYTPTGRVTPTASYSSGYVTPTITHSSGYVTPTATHI